MDLLQWKLANAKTPDQLRKVLSDAGCEVSPFPKVGAETEGICGFISEDSSILIMLGENLSMYPDSIPSGTRFTPYIV